MIQNGFRNLHFWSHFVIIVKCANHEKPLIFQWKCSLLAFQDDHWWRPFSHLVFFLNVCFWQPFHQKCTLLSVQELPKIAPKPKIDQTWPQWDPNLEPTWPKMVQDDNFPPILVHPPHILRSRAPFWTHPPHILRPGVQNTQRVCQKWSSEAQNDRRVCQNWSTGAQKMSPEVS